MGALSKMLGIAAMGAAMVAGRWTEGTVDKAEDPLVILYYEEWAEWVRGYHVSQMDETILSRKMPVRNWVINLAFVAWSHEECRLVPTDEEAAWAKNDPGMGGQAWFTIKAPWGSPAGSMTGVMALKQRYPHIKLLPSVGGWSASHTFSDCIHSNRHDIMVQSAVDFVRMFHFDGIDLDWEFPDCPKQGGAPGEGNCGCQKEPTCPVSSNRSTKGDWDNYKIFLVKLRKAFNDLETQVQRRLYITAAVGMNPNHIRGTGNWVAPMPVEWICDNDYFDWINLMTYDFYGPWSSKTGHLAPLYAQKDDPDADKVQLSVAEAVDMVVARCSRPEKLMMGLATYGKNWANVPAKGRIPGLWQTSQNPRTEFVKASSSWGPNGTYEAGTVSFWDVNKNYLKNPNCKRTWDPIAKCPTLYCTQNPTPQQFPEWQKDTFIAYEDGESWEAKMKFARERGLGGAIIWAASDTANLANAGDSVDQLYSGLFRGWSGKQPTFAPGGQKSFTYKLPTMAEVIQAGWTAADFPCPYPSAIGPDGRLQYNWKSNEKRNNPCYPSDSTNYNNKTPYPKYQGSGTQDLVGKDVMTISKGKNPGPRPDPDTTLPTTTTKSTSTKSTSPEEPQGDSVAKCKSGDYAAYYRNYCQQLCDYYNDPSVDDCNSGESLGACVVRNDPLCKPASKGYNSSSPAWQYGTCAKKYEDSKWADRCQAWCKYLGVAGTAQSTCADQASLAECVQVQTQYKC